MSTTLPLFWKLSSASQKDRIGASVKLVGALEQFQAQFVPKDSPRTSDGEGEEDAGPKIDGLDVLNAQDVSYSIRRLIRGLASPRESSRLGFAVALTELLSRINTVTCSQIVSIILDSSKTQGSMTGQEERDVLFARLFGLTSVIQSGLLVRQKPLPTSASTSALASSLTGYKETLSQLLHLGEKKSWLRESAWWTTSLALDALNASDVPWKEEAIDATVQSIFVDVKIWTPEKVALALKLQAWYPERSWGKYLSPTFKYPDVLSTGNLTTLAPILKESTLDEDEGPNETQSALGNWKPQVHFVWDIILDQLLSNPKFPNTSDASFQEFFRIVVDESLFSSTSSAERKYWGFQIFQKALPRVAASNMPMLFTKNFMRTWINHLSSHDRYLHKAAKQVGSDMQSFVQKNPTLGFTLILQLTGTNGNRQFDKLTKTKTVESILVSMDAEGINTYIDYLLKQVNRTTSEKDDIQGINARRAWIIDQLGALIRNGSIPKNDLWIQSILDWLIVNGLFIPKKKSEKSSYRALHTLPIPAFSDDLRLSCRSRLLGCLADLTGQVTLVKSDDDKTQKLLGVASDGEFWVSKALATVKVLTNDTKHVTLLEDVDEDDQRVRTLARYAVDTLKQVSADQQEMAKGAELLLLACVLHQYSADEEGTDTDVLEACVGATTHMFASGSKKSKKSPKSSDHADAGLISEPIDVLVDAIIGFLEQSTAYLRSVANQAFSLLSGAVQETTIDLILMQLDHRNPAELAADGDEDTDDLEDDEEEESADDEEQASSDEDDIEDGDDECVQELRRKIEETLKVNGVEAVIGNSDDESDEDLMDDDQMMAIDEQLARVFRLRMNEKKSSKDVDAQREATHFKNRVLDLIDIFIKKQPTSQHIIRLILPLVDLIACTGSDEQQLSDKATGILKSRIGKLKDLPHNIDFEEATTVLDELHARARRARSSETLATLNQCSLYLAKVMIHSAAEPSVLQVYRSSLMDFVTRKASALNATFFQDFIRRCPASGWSLRDDIIEASHKGANIYRQCQAFQLLHVLVNHMPALGDRQQEILTFMPTLYEALANFMTKACDEKLILTAQQMKDLFKLGLAAVRQTQRVTFSQDTLRTIWRPGTWDALQKKVASSERFNTAALQAMCLQMGKLSKGTTTSLQKSKIIEGENDIGLAAAKRKADGSGDDEDAAAARKAKRKKVKKAKV